MKSFNFKLIVAYDGTNYHGWQKQPGMATIEGTIIGALEEIFCEKIVFQGASRTDAGVHARGQAANLKTSKDIDSQKIKTALNSKLPKDIAVLSVEKADNDFNARFDACGKHYQYLIYHDSLRSPWQRNYSLFVPYQLDVSRMNAAAGFFIGTHDFASFGVNSKRKILSTVRTIHKLNVFSREKQIIIDIFGTSFLYKMARSIVGTLIEVGRGKKRPEDALKIIEKKDRTFADKTVSPVGLYLVEVFY